MRSNAFNLLPKSCENVVGHVMESVHILALCLHCNMACLQFATQSGEQNQMTEIWLTADSCFWTSQASLDGFCMASSAAAKPRARPRKVIAIQDLDALKAKKQQLKQDLKEMNKTVKVQQQKKRRLMKAAHNLHDEDLLWLLRERQTQRSEDPTSAQDQNGDAAEDLSAENVEPNDTLNSEEHVNRTSDGAQPNE